MPNQPLPWFKVWVGATANGKARGLDDGAFRTWVELLDAAAQQPRRGRFASRAEAAAITRRPAKHIVALIVARLIDEAPDGLTMHDWDTWQRWRKEDAINTGSTPDGPTNGHAMDPRSTPDRLTMDSPSTRDGPRDQPGSLREKKREKRDRDVDEERDGEPENPSGAKAPSPQRGERRRVTIVDDAFKLEIENEFVGAFGSRGAVRDVIDEAMSHTARAKRSDQRAYLRNWVRRDAARVNPKAARRVAAESEIEERGVFSSKWSGCPVCGKANWDVSMGPICPTCVERGRAA